MSTGKSFDATFACVEKCGTALALNHEIAAGRGGGWRSPRRILIKALQVHFAGAQVQLEAHKDFQVIGIEDDVELLILVAGFE